MDSSLRRPLGLVLSAGGALACWQAGALESLSEGGLVFDSVLGFSAGALTGAAYVLGTLEGAVERWRNLNGGILRFSPRLFPLSLFSDRPIWESLDYGFDEEETKARARCRLVVVSARFERSRPVYAVFTPGGRQGWDAPLSGHLAASCAIPLVFPPVRLEFRGENLLLFDGGVPCGEPMSFRDLAGCKDVLILEMVRPEEMGRARRGWIERLDQRARETLLGLIGEGVGSLRSLPDPPRIFRLAPSRTLELTMLSFKGVPIREGLALGKEDARAFLQDPLRHSTY